MVKRGQQDWDKQIAKHEISTRPSLIFNTGTVHWSTNFETPVHTMIIGGTPGGAGALTTNYAFTDCTSLKLTTHNVAGSSISTNKTTGLPETKKVGIECNVSFPANNGRYMVIGMSFQTTTTAYWGYARYDIINKKWQYRTPGGGYVDVPNGAQNLYPHPTMFNHMKVIIDHDTHKYVRLYCNDKEWDLSGLAVHSLPVPGSEALTGTIEGTTNANAAIDFYVDDVTITEETM